MINAINFKRQTTKARPLHEEAEGETRGGVRDRLRDTTTSTNHDLCNEEAEGIVGSGVGSRLCGTTTIHDGCMKRLKGRRGAGLRVDYVAQKQIMIAA